MTHFPSVRLSGLFMVSMAILGGCAVGPDYRGPGQAAQVPAHFAEAPRAEAVVPGPNWWEVFDDRGLDALVTAALASSPDIMQAQARIRQARANAAATAGGSWPQVNASAGISRDRVSENGELLANNPLSNPQVQFTDYRAGFDASWEIDLFGHTTRQIEAATARLGVAEETGRDARLQVAAETVRQVIDARAYAQRLANAREDERHAAELLRLIRLQRQAGLASDSDVHTAEDQARRSAAVPPTLDAAQRSSAAALTVLTGFSLEQVQAHVGEGGTAVVPVVPRLVNVGLPSELLQRRPDVRAAERSLAAATADTGVAVTNLYPRFSLVASLGLDSIHPGQLTEAASRTWSVGPMLTLPIFAGGSLRAQVEASEAAEASALAGYRKAVLTAVADVEAALVRFDRDGDHEEQIIRSRAALANNVGLAEERYRAGEGSLIDVLAARRQLAAADDSQLQARQARATDLTALVKALGGGWN